MIWASNGAAISRLARSYARTAHERDDLLQDIALGLWRALPTFRSDCSQRTFVLRIAHNLGINFATRRRAVEPECEVVDHFASPEARAESNERQDYLFRAIRSLPINYRQVITLALEGLGNQEIAEVLGLTPNNVAVRLSRAKDAMRAALGKHGKTA